MSLDFRATMNKDQFDAATREMEQRIKGVADTATQEGNRMSNAFKNVAVGIASYFTLQFGAQMVKQITQVRGEMQEFEAALQTMLQNKYEADKLMQELIKFAYDTTFDFAELEVATRRLIAMNIATNEIVPTIKMLGDIAAGVKMPLEAMVSIFTRVKEGGAIGGRELMQFKRNAIPLMDELAKVTGKTRQELEAMADSGGISYDLFVQALRSMTKEGGIFNDIMLKQNEALTELSGDLAFAWRNMLNEFGKVNESILGDGIKALTSLVLNYQKVLDILRVIVVTYGAYRAAVLLATAAQSKQISAAVIEGWMRLTALIRGAEKAQIALNIAQKGNLIGLAVGAIALAVSAYGRYTAAKRRAREEAEREVQPIRDMAFETSRLVNELNEANVSADRRLEILNQLKTVNPQVVEGIKSETLELSKLNEQHKIFQEQAKAKIFLKLQVSDLNFQKTIDELEQARAEMEKEGANLNGAWAQIWQRWNETTDEHKQRMPESLRSLMESLIQAQDVPADEKIKAMFAAWRSEVQKGGTAVRSELERLLGGTTLGAHNQTISSLEKATTAYNTQVAAIEKVIDALVDSNHALDDSFKEVLKAMVIPGYVAKVPTPPPVETELKTVLTVSERIAELQKQISLRQQELRRLRLPGEGADVERIKATQEALEALNSELKLLVGEKIPPPDTKSLIDTLKEMEEAYQRYFRWVEFYGKESADRQFETLLENGANFREYLENLRLEFEKKRVPFNVSFDVSGFYEKLAELRGEGVLLRTVADKEGLADLVQELDRMEKRAMELSIAPDFSNLESLRTQLAYLQNSVVKIAADVNSEELDAAITHVKSLQNLIISLAVNVESAGVKEFEDVMNGIIAEYERYVEQIKKANQYSAKEQVKALIDGGEQFIAYLNANANKYSLPFDIDEIVSKLSIAQKAYDEHVNWTSKFGAEAADNMLTRLFGDTDSYLSFVRAEIEKFRKIPLQTVADAEGMDNILQRLQAFDVKEDPMKVFSDGMNKAKVEAQGLIEYLNFLEQQKAFVIIGGDTEYLQQKLHVINEEIQKTRQTIIKEAKETYADLIQQTADYSDKKLMIEQQYIEQVQALNIDALGEEAYQDALKRAKELKDERLKGLFDEQVQTLEVYRNMATSHDRLMRKTARAYRGELEKALEALKAQPDAYKKAKLAIEAIDASSVLMDFQDISAAVREVDAGLADVLDSMIGVAQNLMKGVEAFAKGDYIGVLISSISLIATLFNEFDNSAKDAAAREAAEQRRYEKLTKAIELMNKELEKQVALIAKLTGAAMLGAYQDSFEQISRNIISLTEQLRAFKKATEGTIIDGEYVGPRRDFDTGLGLMPVPDIDFSELLPDFADYFTNLAEMGRRAYSSAFNKREMESYLQGVRKGIEDIERYLSRWGDQLDETEVKYYEDLLAQLYSTIDTWEQMLSDFNTAILGFAEDTLVGDMVAMFEQGKTSAIDFAESFESLMRKALINSLKINALQEPLREFHSLFAELAADGITEAEVARLREYYREIFENAEQMWEGIQEVAGIDWGEGGDALAGAIKGVSEETAGLLAGQLTAIRMTQAASFSLAAEMNAKLSVLSKIEENTRYNRLLANILDILQTNANTNVNNKRIEL